jgi:uncharacterized repeat protein (TIGR01451 family)
VKIKIETSLIKFTFAIVLGLAGALTLYGTLPPVVVAATAIPEVDIDTRGSEAVITSTKTSAPINQVHAGDLLTYTITFISDQALATVTVTDTIPVKTVLNPDTISYTVSSGASVSTMLAGNTIVWTATNVITGSFVTATFVVTVDVNLSQETTITNTAYISGTPVSTSISARPQSYSVFLPIIFRPVMIDLVVNAINTSGITSLTIGPYQCNTPMADGSNQSCGDPFPAGTYQVVAKTNRCGTLQGQLTFPPNTLTVECY